MTIDRDPSGITTGANTKDLPVTRPLLAGPRLLVPSRPDRHRDRGRRGIGAAIASKLAELGAHVFVCGRTQSHLDQTVQSIGAAAGSAEALLCDVTTLASVQEVARIVEDNAAL